MLKDSKTYSVVSIGDQQPALNGRGDDGLWGKASLLADFTFPWDGKEDTSTSFRALHSNAWLYCLFTVQTKHINVHVGSNDKSEVLRSDRVEIFWRTDDRLSHYYCLEIDPRARVLDYEAWHYRRFNMEWSYPPGHLIARAEQVPDGYTVEVAVSKESLELLGVLSDSRLEAGLFRAECVKSAQQEPRMMWSSWVKPQSETPDFHIPSSFGTLLLD